jgi:hypothetical protein
MVVAMRGRPLRVLGVLDCHPAGMTTSQLEQHLGEPVPRAKMIVLCGQLLRRLERAGWVKVAGRATAAAGVRPIIWKITAAGQAELDWQCRRPSNAFFVIFAKSAGNEEIEGAECACTEKLENRYQRGAPL